MKRRTSNQEKRKRGRRRLKASAKRARRLGGNGNGKKKDSYGIARGRRSDEEASRREADAAELQSGTGATPSGEFQVHPGDSEANAVLAGGLCAEAAD